MSGSRTRKLRDQLQKALLKERLAEALQHYEQLERLEPGEPRWPHRKGDLLKRLGQSERAVASFERAVELYAQRGFVARAAAMAKVIIGIDPSRRDVLERVEPEPARRLYRAAHRAVVMAQPELDEGTPTRKRRISTDALPLVPANSSDEMLRFSRPPSAQDVNLELSMVELLDRQAPAPDRASERPPAEHLAQLPSMPLFADVPRPVLAEIVSESELVELSAGGTLIERGTPASALYVLIEGTVQLARSQEEDVVLLGEGDVVGVSCLLDRVYYEGQVVACTAVQALRIRKSLLDHLVEEYPTLGDVLLEVLGRRLVGTLVRSSPMFRSFDSETRARVAKLFAVRRAATGTIILEAGKRADGLYIPMIGRLSALHPSGEEAGRLKLGRALGQHSMLTGAPSSLTVRADTDVLLLRLSARRFEELVSEHPTIVARLEELARRPSDPAFSLVPAVQNKKGA